MADVLTTAKKLTKQTVGANENTWGGKLNDSIELIDKALAQQVSVAITANTTLSAAQAQNIGYKFTGTPGGTKTVTWPTFYGPLVVRNATTDGSALTCGMATGQTVSVPAGDVAILFADGTDFVAVASPSSSLAWVTTIAALRARTPPVTFAAVAVSGYYAAGDKAPVFYGYSTSSTATDDGGYTIKPDSIGGGSPGRWLLLTLKKEFNVVDWGADPAGVLACDTAFANWFAALKLRKARGYIPSGEFVFTAAAEWDLTSVAATGIDIRGDGNGRSRLNFNAATASPNLLIGGVAAVAYASFRDFDIIGNISATVLQIGHDNFSDPCNHFILDLLVSNGSASPSAGAVKLNYVQNGRFFLHAYVPGAGTALHIRQAVGCEFGGIAQAPASVGIAIHLNGASSANVFTAMLTNAGFSVQIDNAGAANNLFLGGSYTSLDFAINAVSAGDYNRFIGMQFAGSSSVIGTDAAKILVMNSPPGNGGVDTATAAGSGAPVLIDTTFTGGLGSSAYTLGDVVWALKTGKVIAP